MGEMNPYAKSTLAATFPKEGNPRETEAWALTESGRRLALAIRGDRPTMREALRLNWRLWTIFQADLTLVIEGAEKPADTVINMLTLCQFVDKHTVDALAEPTPEKIQVLIEINRNIAAGLRESLRREVKQAVADAPIERVAVG